MKKELFGGIFGSVLSGTGATITLENTERIISVICSTCGIIITIVSCILIPLIRWYKKAKSDGKISKEEIEEGKEIIKNGIDSVKDASNKK